MDAGLMSPRLSIIVPCLNEAPGIEACLKALGPLRARGGEVIVVDGGSRDGTSELARPLADRVLQNPRGRGRQMNAGVREAKGEVLLFLHADTLLPERADVLILEGLKKSGKVWGCFDVRLSGGAPWLRLVERLMNLRSRLTGIATGDQVIFVGREAFDAAGGFPDIPLMEDIALSSALKRLSRPLCLSTPVITSSRRWETLGILRTILLMWWLRLRYFLGADPAQLVKVYYRTDPLLSPPTWQGGGERRG